jgi:uncharacterized protein YceK
MEMRNIIVAMTLMLSGCETIYHHNTVYHYDLPDSAADAYQSDEFTVIRDGTHVP